MNDEIILLNKKIESLELMNKSLGDTVDDLKEKIEKLQTNEIGIESKIIPGTLQYVDYMFRNAEFDMKESRFTVTKFMKSVTYKFMAVVAVVNKHGFGTKMYDSRFVLPLAVLYFNNDEENVVTFSSFKRKYKEVAESFINTLNGHESIIYTKDAEIYISQKENEAKLKLYEEFAKNSDESILTKMLNDFSKRLEKLHGQSEIHQE